MLKSKKKLETKTSEKMNIVDTAISPRISGCNTYIL